MIEEWYRIKKNNEYKIVLLETDSFVYTFLDDSYILSYIFKYKVTGLSNEICFPICDLSKIKEYLKKIRIGCINNKKQVIRGNKYIYEKYFYNSLKYKNNLF